MLPNVLLSLLPQWLGGSSAPAASSSTVSFAVTVAVSASIAIYILKHRLPSSLSRFVSWAGFRPFLPFTVASNLARGWYTDLGDGIFLGGVPLVWGFDHVTELARKHHIKGVVNLMDEYEGPVDEYQRQGITQLYLPTPDHHDVRPEDMLRAVRFIAEARARGENVYIHCKAGHGRSPAVVFAWMLYAGKGTRQEIQTFLSKRRVVRKHLFERSPTLQLLHDQLVAKQLSGPASAKASSTDASSSS